MGDNLPPGFVLDPPDQGTTPSGPPAQPQSSQPPPAAMQTTPPATASSAPPTPWLANTADLNTYIKQNPDSFAAKTKAVHDSLQDLTVGPVVGFAKGAGDTLLGLDNLIRKGLRAVTTDEQQKWMQEHKLGNFAPVTEEDFGLKRESLEAKNAGEWIGKGGETVLEFMLGDEALKAAPAVKRFTSIQTVAKALAEHPTLARLASYGLTTLRQAGVSGAQGLLKSGGDFEQALKEFETTGAVSSLVGLIGAGGPALRKIFSQGTEVASAEAGLTATAEDAQKEAEGVATKLGKQPGTQTDLVKGIQGDIDEAKTAMESKYEADMGAVSKLGQKIPVAMDGSPLQKTAQELLGDERVPSEFRKQLDKIIPEKERIQPLLKMLAGGSKTDVSAGGTKAQYTWDEIEAIRQRIGREIRGLPEDSPLRPDLIKLRYAVDDTLSQSAETAGQPEVAAKAKAARAGYAQTVQKLEDKSIQTLSDKNPDTVANILLNSQSVHNVENLRSLIGHENMKAVEGGLFQRMIDKAQGADGSFDYKSLVRQWKTLSPEIKETFWGRDLPAGTSGPMRASRLPEIQNFITKTMKNMEQAGEELSKAKVIDRARLVSQKGAAEFGMAGAGLTAAGYGASLLYKDWKSAGREGGVGEGAAFIVLGLGLGRMMHLPARMLADPLILKAVTKVMDAAGGPRARQAASAAAAVIQQQNAQEGNEDKGFEKLPPGFEIEGEQNKK